MDRLGRMLIYAIIIWVGFNALTLLSAPLLAKLLCAINHGRGFTFALAASCVLTAEIALLSCLLVVIVLVTWPTDLLPIAFASVAGALLGAQLRRLIREHHAQPVH